MNEWMNEWMDEWITVSYNSVFIDLTKCIHNLRAYNPYLYVWKIILKCKNIFVLYLSTGEIFIIKKKMV